MNELRHASTGPGSLSTRRLNPALPTALLLLLAVFQGCEKPKPPPIVETKGVVSLGDGPLPRVRLKFIPMFPGFGAELIAEAVTDEEGRFSLQCSGSSGACVGPHRVVVEEGPPPPGTSGESAKAQVKMAEYLRSLPNRPIPDTYRNVAQTPLEIEIREGQEPLELKLKR
jgi:hypothetical protein